MDNITNQATLFYDNTSTSSNTVFTQILSQYDLSATKTPVINTYQPGQNIAYITRILNSGNASIYNLRVDDDLGDSTTSYVENSTHAYLNGNPVTIAVTSTNTTITFSSTVVLNPGDNLIIVFETSSPSGNPDTIINTQTVSGNGGSATGPVVTAMPNPSATVTLASYASLDITKSASATSIYSGDSLTYTFTITNSGNTSASNVTLSDTFPIGYSVSTITLTTPDSTTPTSFTPSTYMTNNTLSLPISSIPVGTSTLTVSGTYIS